MIHVVLLGQVGLVALAGLVGDVALMCVMALVGFVALVDLVAIVGLPFVFSNYNFFRFLFGMFYYSKMNCCSIKSKSKSMLL